MIGSCKRTKNEQENSAEINSGETSSQSGFRLWKVTNSPKRKVLFWEKLIPAVIVKIFKCEQIVEWSVKLCELPEVQGRAELQIELSY